MNKERKIVSTSLPMIQKEKVPFACVCVWERERDLDFGVGVVEDPKPGVP